jgi:hypothetical protein
MDLKKPTIALTASLIALASAASFKPAHAVEQVMLGEGYMFHSPPTGTCPGLDWHVVVDGDRSVEGMVGWDRMKHTASLTGVLNADDSFHMSAKENGGSITAKIDGKVTVSTLTITIDGTGTGCDKKTITMKRIPRDYVSSNG